MPVEATLCGRLSRVLKNTGGAQKRRVAAQKEAGLLDLSKPTPTVPSILERNASFCVINRRS
jgi:hypothetical protein